MFHAVGKCLSVDNAYETITVEFENNTLTLTAYGDCCSHSWFEEFPEYQLQSLIGKTIVDLKHDTKEIDLPFSNVQEVDRNHVYEFHLDDGEVFEFLLRNSSNGYYDGYIGTTWKYNTHTDTKIPPEAQLIVVIGMPGCGKSMYVKNHYTPLINDEVSDEDTTYHFFDDYLSDPGKIHTHIMPLLLKGRRVIVADSRLCDKNVFQREIIETFTNFVVNKFAKDKPRPCTEKLLNIRKQLTIIKFDDDAYQSVLNVIQRERGSNAMSYIKSIVKIHDSYKTQFGRYDYCTEFGKHLFKWINVDTYKLEDVVVESVFKKSL
jgi:hypothetical protein